MNAAAARRSLNARNFSTGGKIYQLVLKNNVTYLTFIFTGAVVTSGAFNFAGDYFFRAINRGRLYDQIDWTKWNSNYKSS